MVVADFCSVARCALETMTEVIVLPALFCGPVVSVANIVGASFYSYLVQASRERAIRMGLACKLLLIALVVATGKQRNSRRSLVDGR